MSKELSDLLKQANLNNSEGMYNLGEYYLTNADENNFREFYDKAFYYYSKSASLGNPNALYSIGLCYENGIGIEKDFDKAIEWYEKAAEKNQITALTTLGNIYLSDNEKRKDVDKAMEYFERAASQNDPFALNVLGCLYADENNSFSDKKQALKYFENSAKLGSLEGAFNASHAYYEGLTGKVNIKKSILYLFSIIDFFEKGEVIKYTKYPYKWQNEADDEFWDIFEEFDCINLIKEIADENNRVAQYYLSTILNQIVLDNKINTGTVNIDVQKESFNWLKKSADHGFPVAQYELGINYYCGIGLCEKDEAKGIQYLTKSAAQNYFAATHYLQSIK